MRFIRAFARGADWALFPANREQMLDVLVQHDGGSREEAATKLTRVVPQAAIDPAGLARVAALRAEMGFYDPPWDPVERFYDATYWSEATGRPAPAPYGVPTATPAPEGMQACRCAVVDR